MTGSLAQVRLHVVPMTFPAACAFVDRIHRHHQPPQGHKLSFGVVNPAGLLVGVAIVGRPISRVLQDGLTVEVTRLATDGTPNACSALYAAAWRTFKAAGYRRSITYTRQDESGISPRAAGYRKAALLPARAGWDTPSRPRRATGTEQVPRVLWEITTADASPFPLDAVLRDVTRDETRPRPRRTRCGYCRTRFTPPPAGRPPRYCSAACRQAAYRQRDRQESAA
jgi:hypothetical protein